MTPEVLDRLGPRHLRSALTTYGDVLQAHRDRVNRLNVYPVPDGDTGTNMALTVEAVVRALEGAKDMAAICRAMMRGSLMGARGNSGVILSQVLRGISEVCQATQSVDAPALAEALRAASQYADRSVSRPVEGTILTVVRAAAEGAEEAAGAGKALVDVLEAARVKASEALERTPDLLPVLRRAGVVDAGGLGFLLFLDALGHVTTGRGLPEPDPEPVGPATVAAEVEEIPPDAEGLGDQRYEVMFFLEAPDESVPAFKEAWEGIGDSVVVAGGEGLWNCHIHTDDIGGAVEAALDHGRPRDIRVTDLRDQVQEHRCASEPGAPEDGSGADVRTAVVAVASGDGLTAMLRSLGVARVVAGGQSMNPSTAELLEAVEAVGAEEVVVLPNNANVVLVAEQLGDLTTKTVRVVPTRAVPEGLAALLDYEPSSPAEDNAKAMAEAARRVAWGEVTRAVRPSSCEAGPIAEGDWLGISSRAIEVVAPTAGEAAVGLLRSLVTDGHEIVTVVEGEGASEAETGRLAEWMAERCPEVEVEVHHGGQPLYPYLIWAE